MSGFAFVRNVWFWFLSEMSCVRNVVCTNCRAPLIRISLTSVYAVLSSMHIHASSMIDVLQEVELLNYTDVTIHGKFMEGPPFIYISNFYCEGEENHHLFRIFSQIPPNHNIITPLSRGIF